jgi:hypothetical protein
LLRYCGHWARAIAVQDPDDEDSDMPDDSDMFLSGMSIGDIAVSAEGVIVVRHEVGWEAVTIARGQKEDE